MRNRKWLLGALFAATLSAVPAMAAVYVDVAPPEARQEVIPAHRAGYVWAPGYWTRRNGNWFWVRGHWERERHGMYWHPGHWIERDGRYVFVQPTWKRERFAYAGRGYARDRDGDGVPNRADRDRDGDGVPNRADRAPDNPNRR
jgi:hypothetical protein